MKGKIMKEHFVVEVKLTGGFISEVKLHNGRVMGREQVIEDVRKGYSYYTASKDETGNMRRGAEIRILRRNRRLFLRTKSNKSKWDNLHSLSRF